MFISYNEACARDCSTLEQDLVLCEKPGSIISRSALTC